MILFVLYIYKVIIEDKQAILLMTAITVTSDK